MRKQNYLQRKLKGRDHRTKTKEAKELSKVSRHEVSKGQKETEVAVNTRIDLRDSSNRNQRGQDGSLNGLTNPKRTHAFLTKEDRAKAALGPHDAPSSLEIDQLLNRLAGLDDQRNARLFRGDYQNLVARYLTAKRELSQEQLARLGKILEKLRVTRKETRGLARIVKVALCRYLLAIRMELLLQIIADVTGKKYSVLTRVLAVRCFARRNDITNVHFAQLGKIRRVLSMSEAPTKLTDALEEIWPQLRGAR